MNTEHAIPEVIRPELVYLPSPYKEEKVNFTCVDRRPVGRAGR